MRTAASELEIQASTKAVFEFSSGHTKITLGSFVVRCGEGLRHSTLKFGPFGLGLRVSFGAWDGGHETLNPQLKPLSP